jgi:CO/xanthine dehydrogenase Mo-binding subunit
MKRRDFLRSSSVLIVSFAFGGAAREMVTAQNAVATKPLDPREVDSFLAIHPDGTVTIYTSKVDVGTGLSIAMTQMVAEELGISVDRISVVEGDTDLTPDQGGTGGSTGITRGGIELRQAAATARQALSNLGVNADMSNVGSVVGGRRLNLKVDPQAPLKNPSAYTVVGKPILRPDVAKKCTGTSAFLQDFSLAGMLHGRVVRPPSAGAKLMSVDEASIRAIPDVRVVRLQDFLGVVAPDEWAAVRAAKTLKATWSETPTLPGSDKLDAYVRASAVDRDETLVNRGDTASAMPKLTKELSGVYWWPFQSHASLGPSCAVVDYRPEGTTIWTASQGPHGMRANFSRVFGIPQEKLRVIFLDGSGSYGSNGNDDAAADALLLSKAVGKPVRVQWMREDELAWDPKGPPQLLEIRGGLDSENRIGAWETQMWLPAGIQGSRALLAADEAGITQQHGRGAGQISQNGDPPYAASNVKVVVHWLKETPLRLSNLRAPGKIANVFAVESFTDELAAAAGVDPVEFRLRGLTDARAIDVIKRATEMIGWESRPSPNSRPQQGNVRFGRGMAYVRYKQMENYVAMAMEVGVDRATGTISVRRITCAHDCGLVINPDGLRNQIEGCILQTLGRTLHEETKFDRSRVTSVDWASYPLLTFPEVPIVEVALIDKPSLAPIGAGEAATAPVAAALANAVFDATGIRVRRVPFSTVA